MDTSGYSHGMGVVENDTKLQTPKSGASAIQFVVGPAPVNLLDDPYSATNVPFFAARREEADRAVGFSFDWGRSNTDRAKFHYTLCQSVYASFNLCAVGPVILLNVLDPKKHVKENEDAELKVVDGTAKLKMAGVLRPETSVYAEGAELVQDEDYVLSFDRDGYLVISLTAPSVSDITVKSKSIDPEAVTAEDIIGGYDAKTGRNTGLECIEDVFPSFNVIPNIIVCPGWSTVPEVAAAMEMKSTFINGVFGCENIADLDSTQDGACLYTQVQAVKEGSGMAGTHQAAVWPMAKAGELVFYFSAVFAAVTAATDIGNDDVPSVPPSNKKVSINGLVLDDENNTEVLLKLPQANAVNAAGVITGLNFDGWRTWGNNTAAFPGTKDPKDRWINCRRMMTYCENHWVRAYFDEVDSPANLRLTQNIVEQENMWYSSLFANGKIAGGGITFDSSRNPVSQILDGKILFGIKVAFFTPGEYIVGEFEYDPTILTEYFATA